MRRLPIYFLVDVSESMVGEPIQQVEDGMRTIIQELRTDPYALETAYVSVIAFAGKAKTLSALTELYKFYPPRFPIGGGTSLGVAMNHLMDHINVDLVKTTAETKGDWKPIVFLFTDGTPTDNPQSAFERWNNKFRGHASIVCISIGDNADTELLSQISDNVFRLKDANKEAFNAFFKWVTASIKTTSQSVAEFNVDEVQLAPADGINLEKIDNTLFTKLDENFAVLPAKCQTTKKSYLIKFAKRGIIAQQIEEIRHLPDVERRFKLVGAYPIDEEQYLALGDGHPTHRNINTNDLIGQPACPCCGNQLGMVVCECGNVFCVGEDGHSKCPWCGMEGELGTIDSGGIDVTRGRG